MHAIMLLSLLAGQTASKALKYVVPATLAATDCTYPANFTVTNFTTYTDSVDIAKNYTSFHYADVGTGIDTFCNRNSSSKPSTIGSGNQWPCDNQDVTFIYQPTGWNVALTLAEIACPANTPKYEASGDVKPDLACTNSTSGSTCVAKQSSMTHVFDSLEPEPPS